MNFDRYLSTARRYLLGQMDEEECAAREREYFGDEAAVDRIAVVEESLVEDYLAGRLSADERDQFERHYLASPLHRTRVETIRRLSATAGHGQLDPRRAFVDVIPHTLKRSSQWLAIAAAMVIAVGILWTFVHRRDQNLTVSERRPAPAPSVPQPATPGGPSNRPLPPPSASRVFAVTLSPVSVRSATDGAGLVIGPDYDLVALQLEGDGDPGTIARARAVIRTVAGEEVWRGSATRVAGLPVGVIARFDVPAARLGVDDYFVVLFGTHSDGVEQELNRYVLQVRSR